MCSVVIAMSKDRFFSVELPDSTIMDRLTLVSVKRLIAGDGAIEEEDVRAIVAKVDEMHRTCDHGIFRYSSHTKRFERVTVPATPTEARSPA